MKKVMKNYFTNLMRKTLKIKCRRNTQTEDNIGR